MQLIDWRELYAANQAVIQATRSGGASAAPARAARRGHGGPGGARLPSPPEPRWGGRLEQPRWAGRLEQPRVTGRPEQPRWTGRPERPGGNGTWERFTYSGTQGTGPYFIFTPAGLDPGAQAPLVVMLHGCTQTPLDLARGTRMNQAADRHRFVVAYPEQTNRRNPRSCWSWFLEHHQQRDSGEPALLAAITQEVTARLGPLVDEHRIYIAGMSAGAAMAVVMGVTHPDLFAAVGVHSGLAYRSARNQQTAFQAMARGGSDAGRRGRDVVEAMCERARPMPSIVLHGTADTVVRPVNGRQVVEQWLATNGLLTAGAFNAQPSRPDSVIRGHVEHGHPYTRYRWSDSRGRVLQEFVEVEGLGHAWSGGDDTGSYTDPRGPDASELMYQFFAQRQGA